MQHVIYKSVIGAICAIGIVSVAHSAESNSVNSRNTANAVSLDPQHPDSFRHFSPELGIALARVPQLDTETGLYVEEIEPGLFFVTEGIYQSAFLVTDDGVIVFDAPPSFGDRLPGVIQNAAPNTPITHLVYSHGHADHVGGTNVFADVPDLKIIASEKVAETLAAAAHPGILLPNITYAESFDFSVGGQPVELALGDFHAEDKDTIIYLPNQKFLMAVDTITPGEAPFMNFGATANIGGYLAAFEQFLAYDFTHFLSGHVSVLGNRDDVIANRDYAFEVRDAVFAGLGTFGQRFGQTFASLEYQNANLAYRIVIEGIRDECANQVIENWQDRLSVVDVWAASHCEQTVLYYIMH
ncbi:MAG: MBL fold metallo-hydrolase [Rhizobiales bacterium]|nr:MBL fold metallo-hydrolase [Hyphomicrobiales bacterium]